MVVVHRKKTGGTERGVALVIALLVLLLITAVGMGMIIMSNTETNVSANFRDEQTAYFAAKAGIEEGQRIAAINGRLNAQETARVHCQQALARARKDLPPAWQTQTDKVGLADLHTWGTERDVLIKAQTDERGIRGVIDEHENVERRDMVVKQVQ